MSKHKAMWLTLLALTLGVVAAGSLHAQPAPVKIAVVDLDAISKGYAELIQQDEQLKKWFATKRQLLDALESFVFLSQENFQEAVAICSMPAPDAKAARLKELRAISDGEEKDYVELKNKTARNEKENERFSKLTEVANQRQAETQKIERDYAQQYQAKQKEAQDRLMGNIRTVIGQIAKDAGYALVLDKTNVFFGGEDISPQVLERLNKANPAPAPAPATPATPAPATPAPATPATPAPATPTPPAGGGATPGAPK
jgi:Skp family chaperone for outer membrane proteins